MTSESAITILRNAMIHGELDPVINQTLLDLLLDVSLGCYGADKEAMVAGTKQALIQFAEDQLKK